MDEMNFEMATNAELEDVIDQMQVIFANAQENMKKCYEEMSRASDMYFYAVAELKKRRGEHV